MRYYAKFVIVCLLSIAAEAKGQEIVFLSSAVESGVRQHLGFKEEEVISFAQLDTITTLDLSRRGITEVRDLVLMPKLRMLDLSDNQVEDLQPITVLEDLERVDLSFNGLKSINDLSYSFAKQLTINVAFNYISDFSLFGCLSSCDFTIEGAGLQLSEDAPYFDLYHFYADVSDEGHPFITYRCNSNLETPFKLEYGSKRLDAVVDGSTNTVEFSSDLSGTTKVTLTNGEVSESTYAVPPADYAVDGGQSLTMKTGLPEDYQVNFVHAKHGTVEVVGNDLKYTAPEKVVADIVSFGYYQGGTLKGFSYFNLNKDAALAGDVNGDGVVNVADIVAAISLIKAESYMKIADLNGDGKVDEADVEAIAGMVMAAE